MNGYPTLNVLRILFFNIIVIIKNVGSTASKNYLNELGQQTKGRPSFIVNNGHPRKGVKYVQS